jgi:hypothetical protein
MYEARTPAEYRPAVMKPLRGRFAGVKYITAAQTLRDISPLTHQ